jgi:hypothetical protein
MAQKGKVAEMQKRPGNVKNSKKSQEFKESGKNRGQRRSCSTPLSAKSSLLLPESEAD